MLLHLNPAKENLFCLHISDQPCSDLIVSLHNSVDTKAINFDNFKLYTAGLIIP